LKRITVLVDSREQTPLLFPENMLWWPARASRPEHIRVVTKTTKMDTADYALDGYEHITLVERKGSMRELQGNLFTADYKRACAAFERLSEACTFPYLLLDIPDVEYRKVTKFVPTPDRVFDAMAWVMHRYGIRLWAVGDCKSGPQRRRVGDQLIRVLMAHCFHDEWGEPQESILKTIQELTDGSCSSESSSECA